MKRLHLIPLLTLLLLGAPATAAEYKLAFVNSPLILDKAPQADAVRSTLQTEFAPRDAKLAEEKGRLTEMDKRLARDGAVMSADEKKRIERDMVALQRDLARATDEFKEDFNQRRNEELGKMQREIVAVINALAREEGYDLVFDASAVVYAAPHVDLTEKVLERLKAEVKKKAK